MWRESWSAANGPSAIVDGMPHPRGLSLVQGWVSARLFPYWGTGEAEAAPGMV